MNPTRKQAFAQNKNWTGSELDIIPYTNEFRTLHTQV
ncbi:unnamed protein product [Nezara viridula]|uniref:Uncharacterized protein n=1 Tax=Nezara viridula TaxID=85310 RepID=A0A9P0EHZ6_NEZVI|nr:unnamed protein product [Nezara viridula]